MDSEVVKGKPLSKDETKALIELIEKSKIITSKTTNATNNKLKTEEWIRLADKFNATATSCRRTPLQLRLKWENLKKNARKRNTRIRMNNIQTGGGPSDYIPPDDLLDRVSSMLGSTANGFTVPFGGDKEPADVILLVNGDIETMDSLLDEEAQGLVTNKNIETEEDTEKETESLSLPSVSEIQHITPNLKRHDLLFQKPKIAKKICKLNEDHKAVRDLAIAEYYKSKKDCMDAKLKNILIENEKAILENEKLKLEIEKLKTELS